MISINKNIEFIYFDFDNTLGDRVTDRSQALGARFGVDPNNIRRFYRNGFLEVPELHFQYSRIKSMADEELFYCNTFQYYLKNKNLMLSIEEVKRAAREFILTPFELYDGVIQTIESLSNYKLGILSNALPSRKHEIDYLGIRRYFDVIALSFELGVEKPNRKAFEIAINKTSLRASYIALVDDEPNSINMAQEIGFGQTVLASPELWKQENL